MSTQVTANPFFSPTQISGCQLWLDGADPAGNGVIPANGATVSTWADKSGNGLTVSAASSQPTYSTKVVNNLGTVAFNGSQSLTAGSVTGAKLIGNTGSCAIFVVMKLNNSPGRSMPFSWDDGTYTARLLLQYDENSILSVDKGAFPNRTQATISLSTSLYYIFSYSQNGANTSLNVNGTSVATLTNFANNSITSSTRVFNVGSYVNGSDWNMRGNTAEIIFFNTHIPNNFQQVEGYLAWKWGLQANLPSTHPYKNSPIPPLINPPTTFPQVVQNSFFTPTQISGCRLWLDGADVNGNGTRLANGASVSTWVDKSGIGNNAVGTVAPIYDSVARYVLFNGSTQFFTLPNGTYPFGNTPYSIFIVAYTRNAGNPQWVLAGGNETTNQAIGLLFYFTNAVWHSWWVNEYRFDNSIVNNVPSIVNISYSSVRSIIVNGGTASVNSPGATRANPNTSNFIGRRAGGASQFFDGGMAECIVFNSEIPTSQRQQVEGYLAWKWGLQANLPNGHPYKTSPIALLLNPPSSSLPVVRTATWNPTLFSGCRLWLDGADSTTITTVTGVSQWNDKSGNAYNLTQGSTGSQPTRTGNLLNFVSNYYLNIPQAAVNNSSTWSIFFVINPISSSNWIMAKQRDGVNTYNVLSMTYNTTNGGTPQTGSTGFLYWRSLNNAGQLVSTGVISTSTLQIWNLTYDGTNLYFYINGVLEKTTSGSFAISNDTNATNFTLGVWIQSATIINSGVTNFRLGEMLVYNTGLTTAQRQQVEGYLAWKWGLQGSLPATHPFKRWPPSP
jgi:hypothetical protein